MSNEINFTPEMIEQAAKAESAAALQALAQENGIALTAEDAAAYYAQLHPEMGALSDEELDNVSGGCGCESISCPYCQSKNVRHRRMAKYGDYYQCQVCQREFYNEYKYKY